MLMMEKPACSEILSRMACMTDHTGSFSSLSFEKNTPGKWDIAWGVLFLYREPFDQCGGYFDFYGVGDGGFDLPDQLGGGCLSHEFSGDVDGGEGGVYDAASEMLSKPAMVISSGIL